MPQYHFSAVERGGAIAHREMDLRNLSPTSAMECDVGICSSVQWARESPLFGRKKNEFGLAISRGSRLLLA